MTVSDNYLVKYLVQETRAVPARIEWREREFDTYVADIRGVRIEAGTSQSTSGARYYLTLSLRMDRISIEEPPNIAFFGRKFKSEDQQQLAELMKELASVIRCQCRSHMSASRDKKQIVRETICRRLLFGEAETNHQSH